MPNEPSLAVSYTSSIVGVVSAATAVISALFSFLSFKKSLTQFKTNQKNDFVSQSKEKLDKSYMDLSEFVQTFTGSRETKEKRIVRDRIVFSLEAFRLDLESCCFLDNSFYTICYSISLKISDVTYEKNFEKNMRDLSIIKNEISDLKNKLMNLS